jgi:hypothetical protein
MQLVFERYYLKYRHTVLNVFMYLIISVKEHNIIFDIDVIVQWTLNKQMPEFSNRRDVGTQG